MVVRRVVGSALKVSLGTQDRLDSRETVDLQVYPDLQELQDFQPSAAAACPDLQVSLEREVRRENWALQDSPCQVPQDARGLLECRGHQGLPDLQASPLEDRPASLESLDVLGCRETEVTPERLARKVRRATPV